MNNSLINTAQINCARINSARVSGVGTPSSRSDKPVLDPALKAKLVAVWNPRGKTNEDADRAVIRDLTGHGNDLEIKNASYIEGSGYKDGAFVTDGVEDMIVSKKPVSEMIGNVDSITVISSIKYIKNPSASVRYNFVEVNGKWACNSILVDNTNKTGIFGYTASFIDGAITTPKVINAILGDKADYSIAGGAAKLTGEFSPIGYLNSSTVIATSESVYYGGFIAKAALTTDEINQVIAYYNLDWWIEPDGWYDIKKQGITNANHAAFNDKLIDYSGNGRDLQCNNFGWSGNSGVGKYATDFQSTFWTKTSLANVKGQTVTFDEPNTVNRFILYVSYAKNTSVPSFSVNVDFDNILLYYYFETPGDARKVFVCKRGINTLPDSVASTNPGMAGSVGFYIDAKSNYVKIEQIQEVEGGLWHDGVDDNCTSVVNFPAYKDFTVVVDRCLEDSPANGAVISKDATLGTFIFDYVSTRYQSFGGGQPVSRVPRNVRKTSYLSKYTSLEVPTIVPGDIVDKEFHIATGTFRRGDTRFSAFGLYGFLVYPYSMNEFLIERQLKKRKFGTLYPKT